MDRSQRTRPPFASLWIGCAAILALGIVHADRVGQSADPILGSLAQLLGGAQQLGEILATGGGHLVARTRVAVVALVVGWLALRVLRRGPRGRAGGLPAAVALAAVGHSLLLDGHLGTGLALYALAAVVHALDPPERARDAPLPARIEVPIALALLAVFAGLALYRLDVYPQALVDEVAYHEAARMQLGEIPADESTLFRWLGYSLDRFRAQLVPLSLQTAAVAALSPGILAVRLASVAATAAAVLVAAGALRGGLGPRAGLWTLALAGVTPQLLVYGRFGFYISISILHSALCFAAVLRLREHPSRGSAIWLGILIGASACFYQLSWFVPILSTLALLLAALLPEQRVTPRVLLLVGLVAGLALLPPLLFLRSGFSAVAGQTFDQRALWTEETGGARPNALVRIREGLDDDEIAALRRRLPFPLLRLTVVAQEPYTTTLRLTGPVSTLSKAMPRLEDESWQVLTRHFEPKSLRENLDRMLGLLVYAPSRELSRWVPPLVPPLLAPLVFAGLVEAFRRRREPALQLLLVWVIGGALLPGVVGGPLPRRAALMWPFAAALAALTLVSLGRALTGWGRIGKVSATALAMLLYGAAACYGIHTYFGHPYPRGATALAKVLKGLPPGEAVLLAPDAARAARLLEGVLGRRPSHAVQTVASAATPGETLERWCGQELPFTWVTSEDREPGALTALLDRGFDYRREVREGYRLFRVEAAHPGSCE